MKKKKHKAVYIADEMEDTYGHADSFISSYYCKHDIPMKDVEYIFFTLQRGKPHGQVMLEIPDVIRGAEIVFFDYGGFDVCGRDNWRIVDQYSRFFMKIIKEHPSIEWHCTSALPKNCFDTEDLSELKELGVKFSWA